jgi:hypothetical protein
VTPRNQILKETLSALKAAGLTPRVIQNRHIKISWTDPQGRRRCLIVSRSPSARNTIHAARATLRRLLRKPAQPNKQGKPK